MLPQCNALVSACCDLLELKNEARGAKTKASDLRLRCGRKEPRCSALTRRGRGIQV